MFKRYLTILFFLCHSCRPEYLKPVLPGRAPLATTQGYENPTIVDRAIQLKGKVYDGEEELLESGFLVGSSPTVDLTCLLYTSPSPRDS